MYQKRLKKIAIRKKKIEYVVSIIRNLAEQ